MKNKEFIDNGIKAVYYLTLAEESLSNSDDVKTKFFCNRIKDLKERITKHVTEEMNKVDKDEVDKNG